MQKQTGRMGFLVQDFVRISALGCGLLLSIGPLSGPLRAQAYTIAQKIANPSYFVPGPFWTQLNQTTPAGGIAVANVINGPDYQAYPDYASTIQAASASGVKVLGYVRTGYLGTTGITTRLRQPDIASWVAQIEQDVNAWYTFYGSDGLAGIFLDEAQNTCAYAGLYSFLTAYVKQNHPGALVAENPGTAVPSCYQGTADIIVTFEGTYLCYIQDASCPAGQGYTDLAWNVVDPKSIWHLVYNTSSDQLANAAALTKSRGAGWFYITPDSLPNPWDTLPTDAYWSSEQAAALPTGGDTTPPTTPSGLAAISLSQTSGVLMWNASTDSDSGLAGYDIFQNGTWIVSTPPSTESTQTFELSGLVPNSWSIFTVVARDGAGNVSTPSAALNLMTPASDGSLPTTPGGLAISSPTYSGVTLSWTPSTDNLGISAYDIYEGSTKVVTLDASTTSLVVGGLSPATQSTFSVTARDSGGNVSAPSDIVSATTLPLPAEGAISDPGGRYSRVWLTYWADFNLPFGFDHVFIDADNNPGTGWLTASTPALGADYVIENNTLYQYAGSGTDWTWAIVDTINPRFRDYQVRWRVPVSDLTNQAPTQSVVFGGNGFAPTAYSTVVTLSR